MKHQTRKETSAEAQECCRQPATQSSANDVTSDGFASLEVYTRQGILHVRLANIHLLLVQLTRRSFLADQTASTVFILSTGYPFHHFPAAFSQL